MIISDYISMRLIKRLERQENSHPRFLKDCSSAMMSGYSSIELQIPISDLKTKNTSGSMRIFQIRRGF